MANGTLVDSNALLDILTEDQKCVGTANGVNVAMPVLGRLLAAGVDDEGQA